MTGLLPQSNPQKYLQALYTAPFTADQYSIDMDDAHDKQCMDRRTHSYNDFFREIVRRFDFDDALLIDPSGNVVYSAYKGVDLGTNIVTGPYRDSDLRATFEEVLASNTVDHVGVTDFSKYLPAYNEPTAWMMAPIGAAGRVDRRAGAAVPDHQAQPGMTVRQAVAEGRDGQHR